MISKNKLTLIITLFFSLSVLAQINFQPHEISISVNGPFDPQGADIDGDGDLDFVIANSYDNEIHWYENTNSLGDFSNLHIVDNVTRPTSISLSDIDGDGDIDILCSTWYDYVHWYENLDGLGNFGPRQTIDTPQNLDGTVLIYSVDIDSDGDIDALVSSSNNSEKLVWYENIDGLGDFGNQELISTNTGSIRGKGLYATDIDNDGDIDIHTISAGADAKIILYKNIDGSGNFDEIIVEQDGYAGLAPSVNSADIDNDGDLDIIAPISLNSEIGIKWYENLDGQGNLSSVNIVESDIYSSRDVNGVDLDNDGDIDIVFTKNTLGTISWCENLDGLGNFGPSQTVVNNLTEVSYVEIQDFNGDGNLDLLSCSYADDRILWYENVGDEPLSTENIENKEFRIFPNPTSGIFNISTKKPIGKLQLYNSIGLKIKYEINGNSLNISNLNSGLYVLIATFENDNTEVIKVIKN